jgi:hypothetical protein
MKTFNFISDPGHGWLKVPHRLLSELAIADRISHYSYSRGNFAYLEEDCDLSLFFNAYRARYGHDPKLRDRDSANNYSRVRNYDRYSPLISIAAALRINATADIQGV